MKGLESIEMILLLYFFGFSWAIIGSLTTMSMIPYLGGFIGIMTLWLDFAENWERK